MRQVIRKKRELLDSDISESEKIRFWSKVNKTDTCWLWKPKALLSVLRINGVSKTARRISFCLAYKKTPADNFLENTCGNPMCVRPDHLKLVPVYNDNRRREYSKQWRVDNKESYKLSVAKWRKENKAEIARAAKLKAIQYRDNGKSREYARRSYRKKYGKDATYTLSRKLRTRLKEVLKSKGLPKSFSAMRILGCTPTYLRSYLEAQFKPGMTWENYRTWEIDHIIPLGTSKNVEDVKARSHYTNLQPLWKEENNRKGAKHETTHA